MALLFRLYGNFCWPPSPANASNDHTQPGVVEIFFLDDGKNWRAALRWLPRSDAALREEPKLEKISLVDPARAVDSLGDGTKPVAIWIDEPAEDDWLAFRGAFLIEQYSDGKPDLRLPLAKKVVYNAGAKEESYVYSGLRILKNGFLAIRLNLPLPVAQAKESQTPAFPLTLEYMTKKVTGGEDPSVIHGLFGGWSEEISGTGGTLWPLKNHQGVKQLRLGEFGLSERGSKPAEFVSYRENTPSIGKYWPANAKGFAEDLLSRYGFELGQNAWLQYGENQPDDLSLRFTRLSGSKVITGLTYRVRVIRNEEPAPATRSLLLRIRVTFYGMIPAHSRSCFATNWAGGGSTTCITALIRMVKSTAGSAWAKIFPPIARSPGT